MASGQKGMLQLRITLRLLIRMSRVLGGTITEAATVREGGRDAALTGHRSCVPALQRIEKVNFEGRTDDAIMEITKMWIGKPHEDMYTQICIYCVDFSIAGTQHLPLFCILFLLLPLSI